MQSRYLARLIFRINFRPLDKDDYYFDITTFVLSQILLKEVDKNDHILDMGTGTAAIIGLTLWKRRGCQIISSDINPEIVSMAQESIQFNQATIKVVCSNLFENIKEEFDIVVFNPPYVPTKSGKTSNLSKKFQSQWDGGVEGDSVVKQFLDAFQKLGHSAVAYIGINYWYVPQEKMISLISTKRDLQIRKVHRCPFLPVYVYVVEKN